MKFHLKRFLQITLAILFSLVIVCFVNRRFEQHVGGPYLFLLLGDTVEGQIKVYWNTGNGFNETETATRKTNRYEQQLLKFELPGNLVGFRVDTDLRTDQLHVLNASIGYYRWPLSYKIPSVGWTSGNQTQVFTAPDHANRLTIRLAPNASDPYCLVNLPTPTEGQPWQHQRLIINSALQIASILSCFAVILSMLRFNSERKNEDE